MPTSSSIIISLLLLLAIQVPHLLGQYPGPAPLPPPVPQSYGPSVPIAPPPLPQPTPPPIPQTPFVPPQPRPAPQPLPSPQPYQPPPAPTLPPQPYQPPQPQTLPLPIQTLPPPIQTLPPQPPPVGGYGVVTPPTIPNTLPQIITTPFIQFTTQRIINTFATTPQLPQTTYVPLRRGPTTTPSYWWVTNGGNNQGGCCPRPQPQSCCNPAPQPQSCCNPAPQPPPGPCCSNNNGYNGGNLPQNYGNNGGSLPQNGLNGNQNGLNGNLNGVNGNLNGLNGNLNGLNGNLNGLNGNLNGLNGNLPQNELDASVQNAEADALNNAQIGRVTEPSANVPNAIADIISSARRNRNDAPINNVHNAGIFSRPQRVPKLETLNNNIRNESRIHNIVESANSITSAKRINADVAKTFQPSGCVWDFFQRRCRDLTNHCDGLCRNFGGPIFSDCRCVTSFERAQQ